MKQNIHSSKLKIMQNPQRTYQDPPLADPALSWELSDSYLNPSSKLPLEVEVQRESEKRRRNPNNVRVNVVTSLLVLLKMQNLSFFLSPT